MGCCRVLVCLALCALWHVGPTFGQSQIDMNVLARLENLEQQVSGQQKQLKLQSKLIADLQTSVADQESAIAKQQATINEQQTTIVNQQKTISKQQHVISKQQSRLSEQHRRLTRLEGILVGHRTNKANWTTRKMDKGAAKSGQQVNAIDNTIYTHTEPAAADEIKGKLGERDETNAIHRLNKRLVLGSGSPVAFHATVSARTSQVASNQPISFPLVTLNLGSGFHYQHGLFIAPAAGVYIFSTSLLSSSNSRIQASVVKNGAVLAQVLAEGGSSNYDQGSTTVVTQLAIGDEVWVRQLRDNSFYGHYFSSFTGCLLWPM